MRHCGRQARTLFLASHCGSTGGIGRYNPLIHEVRESMCRNSGICQELSSRPRGGTCCLFTDYTISKTANRIANMRLTQWPIFLVCTLVLTGCTLWREHPVSKWADATGGEGLERSFWNEVKAKNWSELERHIAANYVCITPHGRLDRSTALEHLRQLELSDFSLGEVEVELDGNVFVVTYSITMSSSGNGTAVPNIPMRMMTVWQQQKMGWMVIAQTVSPQ